MVLAAGSWLDLEISRTCSRSPRLGGGGDNRSWILTSSHDRGDAVDHERIVLHKAAPPVFVLVTSDGDIHEEDLVGADAGSRPLIAHFPDDPPAGARRHADRFGEASTAEKLREYMIAV